MTISDSEMVVFEVAAFLHMSLHEVKSSHTRHQILQWWEFIKRKTSGQSGVCVQTEYLREIRRELMQIRSHKTIQSECRIVLGYDDISTAQQDPEVTKQILHAGMGIHGN